MNRWSLEEGLSVYWEAGLGSDLVAGDRWTFTASPPVYHYQVFGAPFEAITAVYLSGEEDDDRVTKDATTGLIQVSGKNASVSARVVKDHTTHPVDMVADILAEVGLEQAIHQDSFALAKSLTPEYAIGISFENLTAAQAIREIVRRCLYDLWIDFGEIKIRAYLGRLKAVCHHKADFGLVAAAEFHARILLKARHLKSPFKGGFRGLRRFMT